MALEGRQAGTLRYLPEDGETEAGVKIAIQLDNREWSSVMKAMDREIGMARQRDEWAGAQNFTPEVRMKYALKVARLARIIDWMKRQRKGAKGSFEWLDSQKIK